MNIILLGYNGLIGAHILTNLVQKLNNYHNYKLICVGRKIKKKPFINRKIKYVKWNFCDFSKSNLSFFGKKNIIINCAGKNNNNLKNLKKINLEFVQKLIEFIQKNKIEVRLIHLGSVSVYDVENKNLGKIKNIIENSRTKASEVYSKSKLEADNVIKKSLKINNNKFSYTILRITNIFSDTVNSNAFRLIRLLLNKGIWLKCSNYTRYHFIHAKDVALAVSLCIFNLKISKNKVYIVSDDNNQFQLHKIYSETNNIRLLVIPISLKFLKIINNLFFLPKKIKNFFFTISSEINYNNRKLKKELNFKAKYSLKNKII